ncbi:2-phospho-L-lactate guanylyltransferase [Sphingosinicella soli]|uniref:2-phospho-L-lactate guanylyltransferase n=1 Tax=Sphingosinicella soli TaxID=333708 RepID=A0A7W7B067_9SPHN|nr:2-phospho-L-lactate guanylyltransferase [Sphingosinicella soli]MBB4631603.1 2-phospho-L-lactate guanylyltransferase [Sphingosinicella soli]
MSWTAIVPLKTSGERKSRLARLLSAEERSVLSARMFHHVINVLPHVPAIGRIVVLADECPADWRGDWMADGRRGLNLELEQARKLLAGDLIVLHADLPLLTPEDVAALIEAASEGLAIAPDRHRTGTNGLALKASTFLEFSFGTDSFSLHRLQHLDCKVIKREGFALDLDTPDDLKALMEIPAYLKL